jgi:hypothetical protein
LGATLCKWRIAREFSHEIDFEKRILKLDVELRETKNRKTLGFTWFLAKYFTLAFFALYSRACLKKCEVRLDRENTQFLRGRLKRREFRKGTVGEFEQQGE